MAYSDDDSGIIIDNLVSVIQAFQGLFDIDVDSGESFCTADSNEIEDVIEFANRALVDLETEDF